jgi:hypothetical protein
VSKKSSRIPRETEHPSRTTRRLLDHGSGGYPHWAGSAKSACSGESPHSQRINAHFVIEQSKRQIACLEASTRETVDPTVKSEDNKGYIREMRASFVGLGPDAVLAVRKAIREGDAQLAWEILKCIGIAPNRNELNGSAAQQVAAESDMEAEVNGWMMMLGRVAIHRASVYHRTCPELDAEFEKVGIRINYATERLEPIEKKS